MATSLPTRHYRWAARDYTRLPALAAELADRHISVIAAVGGEPVEAAADAASKCFQANPNFSFAHMLSAATHAKLGRVDAARQAAARVLELEPGYTISGMCAAVGIHDVDLRGAGAVGGP